MPESHRRPVIGASPHAIRRAPAVASIIVLALLSACGSDSFTLNDVTIDLGAVGDTGGTVVVAGQAVSAAGSRGMAAYADAKVSASNTSGSLHVVALYLAVDPATDPSCTEAASTGPGTMYFLCPAADPRLRSLGDVVLMPATPVKTTFNIDNQFWLGVQLVGATSSNATVSFTEMVGHMLLY